ncbi:MAG: hypothetical protein RIR97_1409 [Pseudomonadota bacterium]
MADKDDIFRLQFWRGTPEIEPLSGGMTNRNFLVRDAQGTFVVRLGDDLPVHHISRANELAASRAAHAAGLSPAVRFAAPGLLVMDYVQSRPLTAEDIRQPEILKQLIPLVKTCHEALPRHFRGPPALFWVFHVLRDYGWTLKEGQSQWLGKLADFEQACDMLERAAAPFDIVFGHNDLLAANFLQSDDRYWLIDWDYAGFNTPLFDLGGLASNNDFDEALERQLLELYFEAPVKDDLWHRYSAMKCASLLRETMWSMVSEIHSKIDFDYSTYTKDNLVRFERAFANFKNS